MSDVLDLVLVLAVWWVGIVAVVGLAGGTAWVWQRLVHDHVARAFRETNVPRMWEEHRD